MTNLKTQSAPPAVIETDNDAPVDLETDSDTPVVAEEADEEISVDLETGGAAAGDDDDDIELYQSDAASDSELEDIQLNPSAAASDTTLQLNPSATASDTTLRVDNRPTLTRGLQRESTRWGVSQAHLLRISNAVSLSTGLEGAKETMVEEVTDNKEAMDNKERVYNKIFGTGEEDQEAMETGTATPKQYRLTARPSQERRSWLEFITGARDDDDDYDVSVGAKAELLTIFLRWTFRTSFTLLLGFSCCCFMLLACVFAIAIHIVGIYQPTCISVGDGRNYEQAGGQFIDAFVLSWTTLSTVGYGHIYPNLAIDGSPLCLSVNFFCTFESFVGVLFASFMGAVLMGKIARVQSFAPTTFSDPIVVRYGTGLHPNPADDDTESSSVKSTDTSKQLPFPVLEFRVANRMHSAGGGEIMNCTLNVVASILESEASEDIKISVLHKSHQKKVTPAVMGKAGRIVSGTAKQVGSVASGTAKQVGKVAGSTAKQVGKATGTSRLVSGTARQMGNVAGSVTSSVSNLAGSVTSSVSNVAGSVAAGVGNQAGKMSTLLKASLLDDIEENKSYDPDELYTRGSSESASFRSGGPHARSKGRHSNRASLVDEGSTLAPRRIFSQLEVETPAHPFFKRVWNVRHELNENSALLSAKAKQMIADNNGFWPEELNSYRAIRENLHFHEIIVNLSGTHNATGSVVYSQKVYSFVDVNIGYTFANMLLRRNDGKLGVDLQLLNDVVEQNGGGGEPFMFVGGTDFVDAAVGAAGKVAAAAQGVAGRTQDQIVVTTQNVAARTRETVVHFKDGMTADSSNDVTVEDVVSGTGYSLEDADVPDPMPPGAKKDV